MLKISDLRVKYDDNYVLKNIDFDISKGDVVCIIGPNGCGKTTLLKSISNIVEYEGNISIESKSIKNISRKDLAKKIGLMSQISEVYFPYTVYETVALGRYAYSDKILSGLSKMDNDIVLDSINRVNLIDFKDSLINELSGGQLQRVFLARVFAQDPDILLLDEPTNHLDLKHQIEILNDLKKWANDNKKTVIAVIHDLNLVYHFADKVIMMNDGSITKYSYVDEALKDDKLNQIYNINIREFMIDSLKKWE